MKLIFCFEQQVNFDEIGQGLHGSSSQIRWSILQTFFLFKLNCFFLLNKIYNRCRFSLQKLCFVATNLKIPHLQYIFEISQKLAGSRNFVLSHNGFSTNVLSGFELFTQFIYKLGKSHKYQVFPNIKLSRTQGLTSQHLMHK